MQDAAARMAARDLNALAICVAYIRSSSVLCQQFEAIRISEGCQSVQLLEANLTRWEGRYRMLERAVKLERALTEFHGQGLLQPCLEQRRAQFPEDIFGRAFWRRLREGYEPLLAIFHKASKGAQAKGTPTLSTVPAHYWSMVKACALAVDDVEAVLELKNALRDALEERMAKYVTVVCSGSDGSEDVVPNAIKAALLDPRFSLSIQDALDSRQITSVRDCIIADTLAVMPDGVVADLAENVMEVTFSHLLDQLKQAKVQRAEDVLPWWKQFFMHDAGTGNLCANFKWSVRMYLSMPAGEAPSEQVLSVATDIVTKKRNRLADRTIEQLLIVKHYAKSEIYNFDQLMTRIKEATKCIDR